MSTVDQTLASKTNPQESAIATRLQLEDRLRSGANWFYWIAALSAINSIIVMAHGEWSFVIGLGLTQVVDAISSAIVAEAPGLQAVVTTAAIVVNLVTVSVCALFGLLANKRQTWAFWVGMILYGLDGLLFLPVGDYLSFGFHLFALWCIYGGLRALRDLRAPTANASLATGPAE